VQVAPLCPTTNPWPAIVIAPVRAAVVSFAVTE